jgi:tetratricopeptide (TPR) repeat protein
MTFKLRAVASVCLVGTLLGCAPLKTGAPGAAVAPTQLPVHVVPTSDELFALGLAAHRTGQFELAGQRYAQVLKMAPEHPGALNALGVIHAQSDRTDEAIKLFARAIALAPGSAHFQNNAGYALLRADRLEEAEHALNQALELDPSSLKTRQNLALLASAKAARETTMQNATADTGDKDAPRLVVVAPNVLELQAPVHTTSGATTPAREEATGPSGNNLSPGSAISQEIMGRLAAMSASAELRDVRLEVSNGVGIRKLARRTADRLANEGVLTARLTNALPYRQAETEIQFGTGQARAAQALQSRMPLPTRTVASSRLTAGVQLRLVLGHDMAGRTIAAWLDAEEKPQVASSMQGGWNLL